MTHPLRALPAAALALAALAGPLRGQDAVAAVTPPAPAGVARAVPPTPLVPPSAGGAAPLAAARDAWVGPDKVKHFFLASFVQGAAHSGFRATGAGARSSLGLAGAVTSVVSVGKEWHDRRTTGFSARDLVWDAAGAGVMTLLLRRTAR